MKRPAAWTPSLPRWVSAESTAEEGRGHDPSPGAPPRDQPYLREESAGSPVCRLPVCVVGLLAQCTGGTWRFAFDRVRKVAAAVDDVCCGNFPWHQRLQAPRQQVTNNRRIGSQATAAAAWRASHPRSIKFRSLCCCVRERIHELPADCRSNASNSGCRAGTSNNSASTGIPNWSSSVGGTQMSASTADRSGGSSSRT